MHEVNEEIHEELDETTCVQSKKNVYDVIINGFKVAIALDLSVESVSS